MNSLPRLRRRSRCKRVLNSGRSVAGRGLVLYWLPSGDGKTAVGVTAGKRLGKAIRRNRIKRRLKEALRANLHRIPEGWWFVAIARGKAYTMPFERLVEDVAECLRKAGFEVEAGENCNTR